MEPKKSYIPIVQRWVDDLKTKIEKAGPGSWREELEKRLAFNEALLRDLKDRNKPQKDLPMEPREPGSDG